MLYTQTIDTKERKLPALITSKLIALQSGISCERSFKESIALAKEASPSARHASLKEGNDVLGNQAVMGLDRIIRRNDMIIRLSKQSYFQ